VTWLRADISSGADNWATHLVTSAAAELQHLG
jgi:hypothetical protein